MPMSRKWSLCQKNQVILDQAAKLRWLDCSQCRHCRVEPHYWNEDSMTLVETDVECKHGVHPKMSPTLTVQAEDNDRIQDLFSYAAKCRSFSRVQQDDLSKIKVKPMCCLGGPHTKRCRSTYDPPGSSFDYNPGVVRVDADA